MDEREGPHFPLTLHHLQQLGDLALRSQEQGSCPCPSPAAALRRAGSEPHLENTVELTLQGPEGVQANKLA